MGIPIRGAGDLYGLHGHHIGAATVPLADGDMKYIILALHVSPIADTTGPIRSLPAVCMPIAKAEAIARELLRCAKELRGMKPKRTM